MGMMKRAMETICEEQDWEYIDGEFVDIETGKVLDWEEVETVLDELVLP